MRIAIMKVTSGCPNDHADLDPYWEATDWFVSARNDGACYHGNLEVLESQEGESREDFLIRANQKADEWDRALACPRCYPREAL